MEKLPNPRMTRDTVKVWGQDRVLASRSIPSTRGTLGTSNTGSNTVRLGLRLGHLAPCAPSVRLAPRRRFGIDVMRPLGAAAMRAPLRVDGMPLPLQHVVALPLRHDAARRFGMM